MGSNESPARRDVPRVLLGHYRYGLDYIHAPAMFGRANCIVDAVVSTGHPIAKSRWLNRVDVVEHARWAVVVAERLDQEDYDYFCNADEPGLVALYQHQEWSERAARLLPFAPGSALAGTVGHKKAFYAWCREHGLPVPETHDCDDLAAAVRLRSGLPGSWLLKDDTGAGGIGIWPWPDPKTVPMDAPASGPFVLQRNEGDASGCVLYFSDRGRLRGWFACRRRLATRDGLGPLVILRADLDPRIGQLCAAVASAADSTGISGFDYVISPESGPLLIDSQLGRLTGMIGFDKLYGMDFSAFYRATFRGETVECVQPQAGPDAVKLFEAIKMMFREGAAKIPAAIDGPWRTAGVPERDLALMIREIGSVVMNSGQVWAGRQKQRLLAMFKSRRSGG